MKNKTRSRSAMLGSCNIWARKVPQPLHKARGQTGLGSRRCNPEARKTRFVDAPSVDSVDRQKGVPAENQNGPPRRGPGPHPLRRRTAAAAAPPTLYGASKLIQGPDGRTLVLILVQTGAFHLTPKKDHPLMVFFLFSGSALSSPGVGGPLLFITPQEKKKHDVHGVNQ